MVNENADQLVAHGLVHEGRSYSRVDTAAEPADHAVVANLSANLFDLLGNHVARVPGCRYAGGLVQEVFEHVLAKRRVLHLGVPLHAVNLFLTVGKSGNRCRVCRSENLEALGRPHDLIAV